MRFCTRGTRDKTGERRISSRTGTNRKMPNITTTGWVKKTGISNQNSAWKAWCCESCLTSLPLPTGPYLTLYSNIIVSTSTIDMNENMKRNHKDIEWKQLLFEIPFFLVHPVVFFEMSTCCASDKIIKVCKNLLLTEMFPQKLGDVLRIFHMTTPFDSHRLCPLAHSTVYFYHYPKPWKLPSTNTTDKEPPAASSTDEDIVRASTEETGGWLLWVEQSSTLQILYLELLLGPGTTVQLLLQ